MTTTSQNALHDVPRMSGLSPEDFARDFLFPLRPVVFTDAVKDWAALSKWTPEFFASRYGALNVDIEGETHNMGDVLAQIAAADATHPAPYLHNIKPHTEFPELLADVQPGLPYLQPNWLVGHFFPPKLDAKMRELTPLRLFIGGAGAKFFVLHYDLYHTHAFLSQIYGEKDYILYTPDQSHLMYANGTSMSQVNDVMTPDLARFPKFAEAVPIHLTLRAGETLFVPAGWWHTARMKTASITTSTNLANASNWAPMTEDMAQTQPFFLRGALKAYLTTYGRRRARHKT